MANENGGECTVQWQLANVSQCWWIKEGESIKSPTFFVNGCFKTKWCMRLYPLGDYEDSICVYLFRENDCIGPASVEVRYKLQFLNEDGVISKEEEEWFEKGGDSIPHILEDREQLFIACREKYLPGDTLTVQCQFRNLKDGESLVKSEHLYARTIFNTSRKSLRCIIGKFSTLPQGVIWKYQGDLMKISLILNERPNKNLKVDISYRDVRYIWGKISITDSEGKKETCKVFTGDFSTSDVFADIPTKFVENKDLYLPNDELSLDFDIVLSRCEHSEVMGYSTKNAEEKKCENIVALINDLKSMYNDHLLSDVELRTSTKTFPANKNILSARSVVFRRMFSSDMMEKNSGHVDIDDLDDETIQQMLLFIYTGFPGELQFEIASKLIKAADKYEIMSLMRLCSSFLEDNLSPTTACKALLLADLHQNVKLRKAVLDYMMENGEVFDSPEWVNFMETNIKLAADIMYKKLNPNFYRI